MASMSTTLSASGPGDGGLGLQLSKKKLQRLTEAVIVGAVPVPVPSAVKGSRIAGSYNYKACTHAKCICTHGTWSRPLVGAGGG